MKHKQVGLLLRRKWNFILKRFRNHRTRLLIFETMFEHINNIRFNFRKYFGVNFSDFYDGQMTAFFGIPQIDYFAFSEWLNAPEGMSDKKYIEERFGQEAEKWFEQTFLSY